MTGIDHDGDGRIDMDPDETTARLGRLRDAGTALDAAWPGCRDRIEVPGRLGGGPLGQAFTKVYSGPKQAIGDAMGQLTGAYQTLAGNGDQAVRVYQAADGAAAAEFPR
ncbi:hypothetical protein [Amycolatopsis sp. SID8362]|uniref:hypothetical protein n=1 Tax=Amycolatopsis sp. SID8362 TaxID=2690346 RepID=UPI001368FC24|nr:hypothetical protein [Amycolatopsis sp. SID8362]NBH03323.1 hypothetical protein [Amycolatopsis sp. SID8362]NED40024.1 hypothetical protein [Amycolatopsis sp. SID8362]